MSVGTNLIRGDIPAETDCFIVARLGSRYFTLISKTDGPLVFASIGKSGIPSGYGYELMKPTSTESGFKATGKIGNGLFTGPPTFGQSLNIYADPKSANPLVTARTADGNNLRVFPKYNNITSQTIYSGIWYRVETTGSTEVSWNYFNSIGSTSGWAGNVDTSMVLTGQFDVTFIPYAIIGSERSTSCTMVISPTRFFELFDGWVRNSSTYTQKNCDGSLGSSSLNCIFTGTGCNSNLGYKYCKIGDSCGDCFGACSGAVGGVCIIDTTGDSGKAWYCHNSANPKHGSGRIKGFEIILIIIAVFAFLWIIWWIYHHYVRHM